jgi:uncharacterized protein (TIGR02145 family)
MSGLLTLGVLQQARNLGGEAVSLIKYGKLYTWNELNDNDLFGAGKLITGFSVPTDAQWTTMTNAISTTNGVCNNLKHRRKNGTPVETGFNTSVHPRWDANATHYGRDIVRFGALPGGLRFSNGRFFNLGSNGYWWSSTEFNTYNAWYRYLSYDLGNVDRISGSKLLGCSVRCVRAAVTGDPTTDGAHCGQVTDYDGNIYDTVRIASTVWTVQNLATTKDMDGNSITCYDYNSDSGNTFFSQESDSIWNPEHDHYSW